MMLSKLCLLLVCYFYFFKIKLYLINVNNTPVKFNISTRLYLHVNFIICSLAEEEILAATETRTETRKSLRWRIFCCSINVNHTGTWGERKNPSRNNQTHVSLHLIQFIFISNHISNALHIFSYIQ